MQYIIVQAGGKGTRLKHLTKNKPKALVPVENLPMLFHLFRQYPNKKFIIIADYKKEVMSKYLSAFAKVDYEVIYAEGTGTCSGVKQSLKKIPENEPFMLVWSDLILPKNLKLPEEYNNTPVNDYIGISETFNCRWQYDNDSFKEEPSTEKGVAGFFLFTDKNKLKDLPYSGELVRFMSENNFKFKQIGLAGTKEFGLIEEYEKLGTEKCRPFNKITVIGDKFIKEAIDEQGKALAMRECNWYNKAKELNISAIPQIYSISPLTMELIDGKNIYECDFGIKSKENLLTTLITEMKKLHEYENIPADKLSMENAYYTKTVDRLEKVKNLVPFANEEKLLINGRWCKNVFYHLDELKQKIDNLKCDKFVFIHGDCTFSNLMAKKDGTPVLIDPRGYFGNTELYGDVNYDWAKMYYSIVGNYDMFNLKHFKLDIPDDINDGIKLDIESNNWEQLEDLFFKLTDADRYEIKLIHAIIWLSLTTYAWEDYDSICGAFYNGLYYLEEVL